MDTDKLVRQTADASTSYRERTGVDIARADSTAHDGTVASFTRNNTLIVSSTKFYPVYLTSDITYVQQFEEVVEPIYAPR